MSEIKEIRQRHAQEIEAFQENCPHENSTVMQYMWAPGHFGGLVRVCDRCEKTIDRTREDQP